MPPEKSPILYDTKKTTIWFAVASFVLFVGLVMMIVQDSARDWKAWQIKFMNYVQKKTEAELSQAQKAVDQKKLEEFKGQLAEAKKAMKTHGKEIRSLKKEIAGVAVKLTKTKNSLDSLKQFQDSDRYFYEEYRAHGEESQAKPYVEKMKKREGELQQLRLEVEGLEALKEQKEKALKEFTEKTKETEKEIQKTNQDVSRLQTKIEKYTLDWKDVVLNAPMLDFMNPSLRIQQIVVENIKDDYYFTKVEKVDRCVTCHLGIDQKGFEDAPQPFTTHPNLDLYLSPNSPHPMEELGCTSCHGGNGHSINFVTTAHTPANEQQAAEWKKKYHWHPMKHWGEKMFPANHIEASCAKCHTGVLEVPRAEKLNKGRNLAQTMGCTGCHKVAGFENRWKAGPSLEHVQSKLTEDWIVRWLQNPKEFRPSTKMPQIFHLSNTADEESAETENAAIAGIAAYLMKNSEPVSFAVTPPAGDPEKGKTLVETIGCLGCHTSGSFTANDHGPELVGLGSKVKPEWLYDWIKNPKHYSPNTRMPNLRLTDEEAANIVSYLLQNKNEKFESIRPPLVKPEAIDKLALSYMVGNMRHEDAARELGIMSANEKMEFIGKKTIARQGCFACHDIKGFEDAKPIGTELTLEGSKEIAKLDFGFSHIPQTREAWFSQKLKEPRIFDQGKDRIYQDKLRMPQFDFTEEQIEALTTFLLSLQKAEIPLEMKKVLTTEEKMIEQGRLLVAKFHCQGCHTLDGKQGAVRAMITDAGFAPPILEGEGKKVQEPWLYEFLKAPVTVRPWLSYRMPTFDFHHEELMTLVNYFNHLAGVEPSFAVNKTLDPASKEIGSGRELFKALQCIKCHQAEAPKGLSASFLAPNLVMAKDRLRPEWVVDWLKDPQVLQEGTMMPTFFMEGTSPLPDILEGSADAQIRAIRDYLMIFTPEEAAQVNKPAAASAN